MASLYDLGWLKFGIYRANSNAMASALTVSVTSFASKQFSIRDAESKPFRQS